MYYKVQVATDTSFQNIVWSGLVTDGSTEFQIKNLEYYTRYYWRAKSIQDIYGNESVWSDYCTFVTKGEDYDFSHITTNIYFLSMHNIEVERGIKCRESRMDLNALRLDKNFPVTSASCHIVSMNLEDLRNRI